MGSLMVVRYSGYIRAISIFFSFLLSLKSSNNKRTFLYEIITDAVVMIARQSPCITPQI